MSGLVWLKRTPRSYRGGYIYWSYYIEYERVKEIEGARTENLTGYFYAMKGGALAMQVLIKILL